MVKPGLPWTCHGVPFIVLFMLLFSIRDLEQPEKVGFMLGRLEMEWEGGRRPKWTGSGFHQQFRSSTLCSGETLTRPSAWCHQLSSCRSCLATRDKKTYDSEYKTDHVIRQWRQVKKRCDAMETFVKIHWFLRKLTFKWHFQVVGLLWTTLLCQHNLPEVILSHKLP